MTLLAVDGLTVTFDTPDGPVRAVDGLSFALARGGTLGLVGESGSGKSQAMLALLGLLAASGRATGSARFDGIELLGLAPHALDDLRGARIAMVFQDPMTSLNPYLTIATQMTEVLARHEGASRADARRRSLELLDAVRIADAANRIDHYPHEFSGGMRQRVMIAMALLCRPDLLIADEPTTALDVTVQAQILEVLRDVRAAFGTALVLISHDLGIVAGQCDEVVVLYAGRAVERGAAAQLFTRPQHPYTAGLLRAIPRLDRPPGARLETIAGQPPDLLALPPGCAFAPRCGFRDARCDAERPRFEYGVACHHPVGPRDG